MPRLKHRSRNNSSSNNNDISYARSIASASNAVARPSRSRQLVGLPARIKSPVLGHARTVQLSAGGHVPQGEGDHKSQGQLHQQQQQKQQQYDEQQTLLETQRRELADSAQHLRSSVEAFRQQSHLAATSQIRHRTRNDRVLLFLSVMVGLCKIGAPLSGAAWEPRMDDLVLVLSGVLVGFVFANVTSAPSPSLPAAPFPIPASTPVRTPATALATVTAEVHAPVAEQQPVDELPREEFENGPVRATTATREIAPMPVTTLATAEEAMASARGTAPRTAQVLMPDLASVQLGPDETVEKMKTFLAEVKPLSVAGARESVSLIPNAQTAVRFLRARDWSIPKSVAMYKEAVEWAVEFQFAEKCRMWKEKYLNPQTENDHLFKKHWMAFNIGEDFEKLPVLTYRLGTSDIEGLIRCAQGLEGFLCSYLWRMEDAYKVAYSLNKGHLGFVEVYDLRGFGVPGWVSRAWKAVDPFKNLSIYLERFYPERVRKALIVGTPRAFSTFWMIVRQLVAKATREKISIYSEGKKSMDRWMGDLDPYVDRSQVPRMLGGNASDDVVLPGGYVPKTLES